MLRSRSGWAGLLWLLVGGVPNGWGAASTAPVAGVAVSTAPARRWTTLDEFREYGGLWHGVVVGTEAVTGAHFRVVPYVGVHLRAHLRKIGEHDILLKRVPMEIVPENYAEYQAIRGRLSKDLDSEYSDPAKYDYGGTVLVRWVGPTGTIRQEWELRNEKWETTDPSTAPESVAAELRRYGMGFGTAYKRGRSGTMTPDRRRFLLYEEEWHGPTINWPQALARGMKHAQLHELMQELYPEDASGGEPAGTTVRRLVLYDAAAGEIWRREWLGQKPIPEEVRAAVRELTPRGFVEAELLKDVWWAFFQNEP